MVTSLRVNWLGFKGASEAFKSESIRVERGTQKDSQPGCRPEGGVEMSRRPRYWPVTGPFNGLTIRKARGYGGVSLYLHRMIAACVFTG
jgi:hypothetical protein